MSARTFCWDDDERESGVLTKIDGPDSNGWYSVTSSNGWGCGIDGQYGIVPKVGDELVTWGSFGRPIRGMAINHVVLYYRTPDEQRVEDAKARERMQADRIADFEGKRGEFDARVNALPPLLRDRIEQFRAFKGDGWRWEHEPYELSCCEEAARLAAHFKTGDELKAFSSLGYEQQRMVYPQMDSGHSGNSWGFSVRLAWLLCEKPDLVGMEHGALCGLVGCEDYGCYAARSTP